MLTLTSPEIQFAVESVRQAALLARQIQRDMVTPALTKEDRSPVTVADFAVQALVGQRLAQVFPEALLVAEEDSSTLREVSQADTLAQVTEFVGQLVAGADPEKICSWIDHARVDTAARFWTLDPIDGTKGFLRGDQYALALALVVNGQVQVGVLGCPNLSDGYRPEAPGPGSLVVAARGQGAWVAPLNGQMRWTPLHTSERSNPREARVFRSFEAGHTNVDQVEQFVQVLDARAEALRMDSQAKYAVLAAGQGEILLRLLSPSRPNYQEKIWDQAAGSIILEEAGGRISDLDGQPLDYTTGRSLQHNRGVLASNGPLHAAALSALHNIGA